MHISHQALPSQPVLIKRTQVEQSRQAEAIVAAAKRQAKKILATAEKQAEAVRQGASREGYETGMLKAASAVAAFFQDWLTLEQQRQQLFLTEVSEVLKSVMVNETSLMQILAEFMDKCSEIKSGYKFELLIPREFSASSFIERLRNEKPDDFVIDYHQGRRLVMKYHDLIAVFDAEDVVGKMMSHFAQKNADTVAYQKLSEGARDNLYQELCVE